MKKIILTAEQAKSLDLIKANIADPEEWGVWYSVESAYEYKKDGLPFKQERKYANELTDKQFLDALVFGYEVEQPKPTAIEVVRKLINEAFMDKVKPKWDSDHVVSYNNGILRAFDELEKAGITFVYKDEQ